jgi:hypothetical protein
MLLAFAGKITDWIQIRSAWVQQPVSIWRLAGTMKAWGGVEIVGIFIAAGGGKSAWACYAFIGDGDGAISAAEDVRYATAYKTCSGTVGAFHLFAWTSNKRHTGRRPWLDKPSCLHIAAAGSAVCWTSQITHAPLQGCVRKIRNHLPSPALIQRVFEEALADCRTPRSTNLAPAGFRRATT